MENYNLLNKIKITPLAAESLGVRSMCTLVETPDIKFILDAGVSLCPFRYDLVPHPIEYQTIAKIRKKIEEIAKKVDIITISHFHTDHYTPIKEDWIVNWTKNSISAKKIYSKKKVFIKSPFKNITKRQKNRANTFLKKVTQFTKKIEVADNEKFKFGDSTTLEFSQAVSHGPDNNCLGWVIMLKISFEEEKFIFAPDIQGPMVNSTLKQIISNKPDLIMLGGPPLYLSNSRNMDSNIELGLLNLKKIIKHIPVTIFDHHILRDKYWKNKCSDLFKIAIKAKHKIKTAAEYLSLENKLYEANRQELYIKQPPSRKFKKWIDYVNKGKINIKPPIK